MAVGDTSFEELTVPELRAAAKMLSIKLPGDITKKGEIIKFIEDNGATWELYEAFLEADEADEEELADETGPVEPVVIEPVVTEEEDVVIGPVVEEEATVVLRMTRANPSYQIRGYFFTEDHPYAVVKESDADYLVEVDGGFRIASPREIREFYGA